MSILRASGSARPGARKRRIGFRQAVPVRQDRRDLRRLLRRGGRAALVDRQAEVTVLLDRLATDHVPLSDIRPGPWPQQGVVEFLDGTRLLLTTRRVSTGMDRLRDEHRPAGAIVWLIRAQPSFANCWFRLWFASVGAAKPAELLVKGGPAPV